MDETPIHGVTGAYGYTGRYIAVRLLAEGANVRTLTNSANPADPLAKRIQTCPLDFNSKDRLTKSLEGVLVMYNTYWVRFNHRELSFSEALRNSVTLFEAARKAGVKRIVHISVTNPSEDSTLEYFRGKALVEQALRGFGFSYAILRPALIFGSDGILINNIAWALRRLPVFGVFGDGRYRLRPICVEDLAQLAVREGAGHENHVIDAVGPEVFTYRELVEMIAVSIGKRRPIISVPPDVGYCVAKAIGILKNDVFLTRDEIRGLMANLLYVDSEPTGSTKLSEWLRRNASTLGTHYARELSRRTWKHFSVK